MKHEKFEFEEEFKKLYTNVNHNLKSNEIQLFDTNVSIQVFYIQEEYYISLKNALDVIENFLDYKLNSELYEYLKSLVETFRLVDLDESIENKDLEVCKANCITNLVLERIIEKQSILLQQSEDILFNKIDMVNQNNSCDQSITEEPLKTMYPFIPSWNDTAMNDILQNIYSNNDYNEKPVEVEEDTSKKYMGRGRCRAKQASLKERPFICEYPDCKRAFKRFEHLKRHNKMHTGERPYKCGYPGCMKAFSRSDNLSQHFKIHNVPNKGHSLNFRSYGYLNKDLN